MTIGRRIVTAAACGSCVLVLATAPARADLPASVRENPDAQTDAAAIGKFVTESVSHIKPGDPKAAESRETLCRQMEAGAVVPAAGFQAVFAPAVVTNLQPMLNSSDVLERVNAGIIICRMAIAAPQLGTTIQPVAVKLLNDPSPAVALWGFKAAGAVLPQMLNIPLLAQQQKLTPAIAAAFARHDKIDAIVQEAYASLYLPEVPAPSKAALGICAAAMADLLDIRMKEYATGVPINPQADKTAILFVSRTSVLQNLAAPQRLRILQTVSNLLVTATRRAAALTGTSRDDVYSVVSSCAGAMYTAMQLAGNAAAVARYTPLLKVPGTMSGKTIVDSAVAALVPVRDTADYKAIKDPPPAG